MVLQYSYVCNAYQFLYNNTGLLFCENTPVIYTAWQFYVKSPLVPDC
jgi:hypothetical protein